MKALSIRQPWAWAIMRWGKRIENRSWCPAYRGPVLIHAAKGCTIAEAQGALVAIMGLPHLSVNEVHDSWPGLKAVARGGFIGRARIVDVLSTCNLDEVVEAHGLTEDDLSWWSAGRAFGIVLADVTPIPFRPWPGSQGLFDVPDAALEVRP